MDAPGIRDELRDMTRRLGTVGYYVLLPNLYYRVGRDTLFGPDVLEEGSADSERMRAIRTKITIRSSWLERARGGLPRRGSSRDENPMAVTRNGFDADQPHAVRREHPLRAQLAPNAAKPVIGGEGRHPHALMRDARHDDSAPSAGHPELGGFRLPAVNVELRPRKPVWPLRHRGVVPRKVLGRPVDVLVAGKDHQRIAKKTNDIVARQPDAAEPVGVVKVERRQRIPAGIGGFDRLENAVRLRGQ